MRFRFNCRRIGFAAIASTSTLLILLPVVSVLHAQDPTLKTRPKDQVDSEYLSRHRVTLNVNVTDASGKPVVDLDSVDFALFDNNEPKKFRGVQLIDGQAMNDATEVLIVLDAVNSTPAELKEGREAIFNYLARHRGPLPYLTGFGLWFNGHMKMVPATTDRNELGRAFVDLTKGVHSNACAAEDTIKEAAAKPEQGTFQAIASNSTSDTLTNCQKVHFRDSLAALDGVAQRQKALGGRTILIWVGAGWPVFREMRTADLPVKAKADLFDNVVDLLRVLRDAQMTIDAVAPASDFSPMEITKLSSGSSSAEEIGPANLALPVLATQTGGRVLPASHDLTTDLASCIRDADSYYALTFEEMRTTTAHQFHKVEVRVNRPGLTVRALTTYYAEP